MKIIGFTGNYGSNAIEPQGYLMADSSILYTGRPFFVPDYAARFVATPTIVVRTGRLGKCIAPKFAHRYWDALTAGWSVQAQQGDDSRLEVLGRAFDGAALVGDWVEAASLDDPLHAEVRMMLNGDLVAHCCLADMVWPLCDMLSAVSTRCSIKMGDLLFTGDAAVGHELTPGDRLTATVNGQPVLDIKVRL